MGERLSPYVSICCVLMAVSVGKQKILKSQMVCLRFRRLNEDDRRRSWQTDSKKERLGEQECVGRWELVSGFVTGVVGFA